METRDKFRQMVKYLLNGEPTKDAKTIDNYTDSLMLGCQQYHEEQVKKDLIAGVVGRFYTEAEIKEIKETEYKKGLYFEGY